MTDRSSPGNSSTGRTLHPVVMLVTLVLSVVLVFVAYLISDPSKLQAPDMPLRWITFGIGSIAILVLYGTTRHLNGWQIDSRRLLAAGAGVILYAVLLWVSNGQAISSLSISQISLRPAIAVPILFGFWFGPLTGYLVGLVGNIGGDLLSGFGVSPQWDMGNGLIGLCAGVVWLVDIKRRQQTAWAALGAALVLAVGLVVIYLANQLTPNVLIGDSTPISAVLGLSPVIGMALVVAGYLAMLMFDPAAATAAVWGSFGNLVGIGFAALSDIAINQYTPAQAVVGEWIPAAGPNLIALAVLVPLVLALVRVVGQRSDATRQPAT